MIVSRELEHTLRKLYEMIDKSYPEDRQIDYEKYLNQAGVYNLFNQNLGFLTIILDIKKFKIVYISKNVFKYTGYHKKEFGDNIASTFTSLLAPEHISYSYVFASWGINILKSLSKQHKLHHFLSSWGVKFYNKAGESMRWYISAMPLELDDSDRPVLVFLTIQDITHLMKGDDYWIRGVFGKEDKKIFVYHSNEEKSYEQDILSEREQEVLTYLAKGLNTKDIATILGISPNTVDNHRRNMLARTGTRDTTALIHLCKMMGVI